MIEQVAGHDLGERAAYLIAESDPLRAVAVLARGLAIQPRGGRVAAVRRLVEKLIEADPALATALRRDLEASTHGR